jgi:hypothetical protein
MPAPNQYIGTPAYIANQQARSALRSQGLPPSHYTVRTMFKPQLKEVLNTMMKKTRKNRRKNRKTRRN